MPSEPLFRYLADDTRKSRLISLRAAVRPILANNLQTEFTDHTCDHSDAVASLVDKLIEPLQSHGERLSDQELFVVYAACYTHDLGMQYERAGATRTVRQAGLGEAWERLSHEERSIFLRTHHHEISADMVMLSVRSPSPPIGISLEDADDPGLVASLCQAHILDVGSSEYRDLMAGGGPAVRMDLLSGLLRMADILEESRRRANRPKAETLLLPLLSRAHWWRHYYTRDVVFSPADKTITLVFDFPPQKREEYAHIVPQLHLPNIQRELRRHDTAFARNGVIWVVKPQIDQGVYGTSEDMPADIEAMMLGLLKDEADREVAEHRRHLVYVFEQARPLIARLLDEIEALAPTTPPAEKAIRLEMAADQLHQVGALHGEASVLGNAYRLYEQAGETRRQFALGLRLIELLSRDGQGVRVYQFIQECERIAEAAGATPEQRWNILVLKAQTLGSLCGHPSQLPAYRQAVSETIGLTVTLDQSQVSVILSVELAEAEWLLGESEAAMITLRSLAWPVGTIQDAGTEPHPCVRAQVIRAHIAAGKGNLEDALASLNQLLTVCATGSEGIRSRLCLLNARAQLCYLADQAEDALQLLVTALEEPALRDQPRLRLVLDQNHLLCRLASSAPGAFRLHDELRDAGRLTDDAESDSTLLRALNAQRAGQHNDAWPAFWQELCHAYRSGEWERYRKAEEYYATQCFLLGWLDLTAHHAVRGQAPGLVENTAKALLARRDSKTIQGLLSWLMENRLTRHYVITCKFLIAIADAVPDARVGELVRFLLSEAASPAAISGEATTVRPAWQALHALAPALDQEQAEHLVEAVEQIGFGNITAFLLEKIIEVLHQVIPALSERGLDLATNLILPLADGFPRSDDHQIYYGDVLDALAHIQNRLDTVRAEALADRLFPPGGTIGDLWKLTVLLAFHKFKDDEANRLRINELARNAAGMLRLQVQQFAPGDPAEPQGVSWSLGTMANQDENGRRVISMGGGSKDLWAAVVYLQWLEPQTVQLLLQACLDMAVAPENVISNRTSILQAVGHMGKALSEKQRGAIRAAVLPLAQGALVGDTNQTLYNDAHNPLNRFKINLGNPDDLRGAALQCLVQIERDAPQPCFDWIWALLEEVIVSPNVTVRQHATTAIWLLPAINAPLFTALLCGLHDADPDAAAASYWALASKESIILDEFKAGLLFASLERAVHNGNVAVRAGASALVKRVENWLPSTLSLHERRLAIQQLFDGDICRSVREAAYCPIEKPDQEPPSGNGVAPVGCLETPGSHPNAVA